VRNRQTGELDQLALATLAGELVTAVGRLEADWERCGRVTSETAERLHQVRTAAEQLFVVPTSYSLDSPEIPRGVR